MKPEKQKKKAGWVTVTVNILFILAICAVGWRIVDYLIQEKKSADLSERLWQQAVVTVRPAAKEPAGEQALPAAVSEPAVKEPDGESVQPAAASEPAAEEPAGEQLPPPADSEPAAEEPTGEQALQAAVSDRTAEEPAGEQLPPPANSEPAAEEPTGEPAPPAAVSEPTASSRYPDDPNAPEQIDFDSLRQISKDACAWLYAPETGINHPVMHTYNNDYYLKHQADGTKNKAGALFMDYRNAPALLDRNIIIYGHNLKNRTMFGQLTDFKNAEYCREHPFLYLYVPGHRFRLEVAAAIDTLDGSDYYRFPVSWSEWQEMLAEAVERSAYDFGVQVKETDHFITLSTCAYDYELERWIVICRIDDPEGILQDPLE